MKDYSPNALSMLTEFFTSDTIEQTARCTGFVRRRSKMTGKVFLALVTLFALISQAGAYFLSRLNHQTNLYEGNIPGLSPLDLVKILKETPFDIIEKAMFIGDKERVASRLIAVRLPDAIVNERRRVARKAAKKKGYTPTEAHLFLLAWNLFITNVPGEVWTPKTVVRAYPIRWQIELIFKSWKSHCHLATINGKKKDTVLCYLYGSMLLVLFTYALYPQVRSVLWAKKHRELSLLKFVSHFQALADSWMKVILESELALRRFLQEACDDAERLAAKASRKRCTSAQILRESLDQLSESIDVAAAVNA